MSRTGYARGDIKENAFIADEDLRIIFMPPAQVMIAEGNQKDCTLKQINK